MPGIGIAAVLVVIALVAGFAAVVSRYKKVGPEEALIISNRKSSVQRSDGTTEQVNFRVVRNGGALVVPVLQKVSKMSLHSRKIEVSTQGAMSTEGVKINVDGVALVKVASDDIGIVNAAERFLGRENDIDTQVKGVLDGTLRGVCGTLTPEDIYRDRTAFGNKVTEQVQAELAQMGLVLDVLTLQEIDDELGYFDALGKKRTAEVQKDARIGQADADKQATIAEAEAKRDKEKRTAETEAEISEAQKERDVKRAKYEAETKREQATAEQAGPRATAEAEKAVAEARKALAMAYADQREQELVAETVRPAEAEKKKKVIEAEAKMEARKREAEAENYAEQEEGKGEGARIWSVKEQEAKGVAAVGKAEAEAIKAKLLAEADGWQKRAVAMKAYSDAAMALELGQRFIDKLPEMIAASASALAAVEKVQIFDFGSNGNSHNGSGPVEKFMGLAPQNTLQFLTWMKEATGIDLAAVLQGVQAKLTDGSGGDTHESVAVEETPVPRYGKAS